MEVWPRHLFPFFSPHFFPFFFTPFFLSLLFFLSHSLLFFNHVVFKEFSRRPQKCKRAQNAVFVCLLNAFRGLPELRGELWTVLDLSTDVKIVPIIIDDDDVVY